jgi:peptide/nickel transport system permease protein
VIVRRLLSIIPLLIVVSFAVFCLELFLPGDPAANLAGESASQEQIEEIRQELELDKPLPERYWNWVTNAVQGDFGRSLYSNRSVSGEIAERWTVTATLVGGAILVAVVVGVPFGIVAGTKRGRWPDRLATVLSSLGVALPNFLLGILLILVFSIWLKLLPVAGYVSPGDDVLDWARHLILPILAVSGLVMAELTRQLRSSMAETEEEDYTRTARAKGLPESTVVGKHSLRLAIVPAIAVLGVQAARLFGGAVIVEQIFSLPGLGQLTIDAILNRDLPVLQGIIPLAVVIAVVMTLLADLARIWLNPQLRRRATA